LEDFGNSKASIFKINVIFEIIIKFFTLRLVDGEAGYGIL